jgi:NAD(P)-dependent dehydrogenase (short-subunit alcohol dehydrogenase family)
MNILVTGGASGLGKSIVEKLAVHEENRIFFTYFKAEKEALDLCKKFSNVTSFQLDLTQESQVTLWLDQAVGWDLDVVIHNAYQGPLNPKHFHQLSWEEAKISWEKNVGFVFQITQACLKTFKKKKSGKFIGVATDYLHQAPTGFAEYRANKSYLQGLYKQWASEFIKWGISCNTVSPQYMATGIRPDIDDRIVDQMISGHPLKRLLTTDETAQVIHDMCYWSAQVNGVDIPINAGQ